MTTILIVPILSLTTMAIVLGIGFGATDSREIVALRTTGAKFNHALALAYRVAAAALVSIVPFGIALSALMSTVYVMAVTTIVHRVILNRSLDKPFWYMGPADRSGGESIYDTVLWKLSGVFTKKPWAPFVIAMAVELTSAIVILVALGHLMLLDYAS